MTEDFGALYGDMVMQATGAGLRDVAKYISTLASLLNTALRERDALMIENTRLHQERDKVWERLIEEEKKHKPDRPLVHGDTLLLALEILDDAGLFNPWDDVEEDLRFEIGKLTEKEHD